MLMGHFILTLSVVTWAKRNHYKWNQSSWLHECSAVRNHIEKLWYTQQLKPIIKHSIMGKPFKKIALGWLLDCVVNLLQQVPLTRQFRQNILSLSLSLFIKWGDDVNSDLIQLITDFSITHFILFEHFHGQWALNCWPWFGFSWKQINIISLCAQEQSSCSGFLTMEKYLNKHFVKFKFKFPSKRLIHSDGIYKRKFSSED